MSVHVFCPFFYWVVELYLLISKTSLHMPDNTLLCEFCVLYFLPVGNVSFTF